MISQVQHMTRLATRLALVAAVTMALSGHAFAAAVDEPAKPADAASDKKDDKKDAAPAADGKAPVAKPGDAKDAKPADKKSDLNFRNGYKLAYDAVYRQQDYAGAIAILSTLGHDDHPDVANLIGFASRKLGRTEDARAWYEKALAANPNHSRTLQYYGMWHLERGDRARAESNLERIRLVCGQDCEDFTSLRDALNGSVTY